MKILVINKTNASHTTNKQWKFDRKQHPTLGALPHLPPGVYIAMQVRGYIIKNANITIIMANIIIINIVIVSITQWPCVAEGDNNSN